MTSAKILEIARLSGRFWTKVDREGPVPAHCPELGNCWVWTGAITRSGYGKFSVARKAWERAHVVSRVLVHGPVAGGHFVLHHCDNPACVRPSHLFTGTAKDNAQDMIKKGRWGYPAARGERNAGAKVTGEQVIAIRERFAAGELREVLAAEYGITPDSIGDIVSGRSWRHVGGPIRPAGQKRRRPGGRQARREHVCASCGHKRKNQGQDLCGQCHESTRSAGGTNQASVEKRQSAA
jgi:hypothetical protein